MIRPGGFLRPAWRDEIDDSAQYAAAWLPRDYDAEKSWPMVVYLHAGPPFDYTYVKDASGTWFEELAAGWADRHEVIVLAPWGRGSSGYRGIGELDVLRAIRETCQLLNVDKGRIYLMGASMGGSGSWSLGSRYPDIFAAIAPSFGGWDYHASMEEDRYDRLTPRERFLWESWATFAQAEALLTTPVFVHHGDKDDIVPVEFSQYGVRMLQRWGYDVRYQEHPGGGHGGLGEDKAVIEWFLKHKLQGDPARVRVRAAYLQSARAHWVRVLQRKDPFAFIRADAEVTTNPPVIDIQTENVLEVRLTPGANLVDPARLVRVVWNGKDLGMKRFEDGAITLTAEGYEPGALFKNPDIAGPIAEVTNTPFAIVAGTISKDPLMRRFCLLRAEAERDNWKDWQHVMPRYFLDTEITDEEISKYSLILIGGPDENKVTRRLANEIPLKITKDAITIGGKKFAATDAAVAVVRPHPKNPKRYVLVKAGNSPAGMFLADSLPDEFDFVIADGRVGDRDSKIPDEHLWIASGSFDHNWQFQERYVIQGDPAARASALVQHVPTHITTAVKDKTLMLSDVLEVDATGTFKYLRRDMSCMGGEIRLSDSTFDKGIATRFRWHTAGSITYDLEGGGWRKLKATIGIELTCKPDQLNLRQKDDTRVLFEIFGDGKSLYKSPMCRWDSEPMEIDVDVTGVKELRLTVCRDRYYCAAGSVNWADLRLEK